MRMIRGYECFECDERHYSTALWPFGVGAPIEHAVRDQARARLATLMTREGEFRARPAWPYFDLALAHQLLLAGDSIGAWAVVNWFFRHQLAPGLYTWGEGSGPENGPGHWESIRGWIDTDDGVTPHYLSLIHI